MAIREWLRGKTRVENQSSNDEACPSIVMLLREGRLLSDKEAVRMATDAWGKVGPVELIGKVGVNSHAIRVDKLFFAIHSANRRYEIPGAELPEAQQQCWDQHNAWMSVDIPTARITQLKEQGHSKSTYNILMFFVFKNWSANCLGIYFPAEGVTVPNLGDLIESIRWSARNGIDLKFLK